MGNKRPLLKDTQTGQQMSLMYPDEIAAQIKLLNIPKRTSLSIIYYLQESSKVPTLENVKLALLNSLIKIMLQNKIKKVELNELDLINQEANDVSMDIQSNKTIIEVKSKEESKKQRLKEDLQNVGSKIIEGT